MSRSTFIKLLEKDLPPSLHPAGQAIAVATHLLPIWQGITTGHLGVDFTNATHCLLKASGPLDLERLKASVRWLKLRFPILTARIDDSGPASAFVFGNPDDPRLEHIQAHPASRLRQKFALSKAARAIWRRFVAGKDPLSRFFVISAAEDEHYIGIVLNHFIGDAGSVSMLARELVAFYRSATSGTAPTEPATLSFPLYARAVETWATSQSGLESLAYWRSALAGAIPTGLPRRSAPVSGPAHTRDALGTTLPANVVGRLRQSARTLGTTPFLLLLAAKMQALHRITGQDDLSVLVMNQRRNLPCLMDMVGNMTDLLPIRIVLGADRSLPAIARQVRSAWGAAQAHALLPHRLVMDAGPQVEMPIFNFIDQTGLAQPCGDSSVVEPISFDQIRSPFWPKFPARKVDFEPFYFLATKNDDVMNISIRYSQRDYEERIAKYYLSIFCESLDIGKMH